VILVAVGFSAFNSAGPALQRNRPASRPFAAGAAARLASRDRREIPFLIDASFPPAAVAGG
jgi:hypothetical protein